MCINLLITIHIELVWKNFSKILIKIVNKVAMKKIE